ncbi:hypothetical protein HDU84_005115 [Entophlyctis sp. JEL0112]|nr:hypothetical protein HDU84_005115 [Entophlyctis sp. JEL0112]
MQSLVSHSDGRVRNILIDCGKSFYPSAMQWFVHYDIARIDAVLLTHDHADAMMGLDDLRAWTYNGSAQESIPIYLNSSTMKAVASAFPYMINTKIATGGGSLPSLKFHVYDLTDPMGNITNEYAKRRPDGFLQFSVEELNVVAFPVQHGFAAGGAPYYCTAFQFPRVTYVSDTNFIPPDSEQLIKEDGNILVLDCLREVDWASHMGYHTSIKETLYLNPKNVYYTGLGHELEHEEFVAYLREHEGLKSAG